MEVNKMEEVEKLLIKVMYGKWGASPRDLAEDIDALYNNKGIIYEHALREQAGKSL